MATKEKGPASDAPDTGRGGGSADRRQQIVKAAVEVFAERGFHRTRVSDIARRAGVAYGLIYHYFDSKDHLLDCIFDDNWSVFLKAIEDLRDDPDRTAPDKLRTICGLLIDTLEIAPRTVQVLIQEVARSDRFVQPSKVAAFRSALEVVQRIIEDGQAAGILRASVDPEVAAYAFFGALETVCSSFMLKRVPLINHRDAESVKATLNEIMLAGLGVTNERS